jgi:hypothetical protein
MTPMSARDASDLPDVVPSRLTAHDAPAPGLPAAIERLAEIVAEENRLLEAGGLVSVEASTQRKSRALLELTRLARGPLRAGGMEPGLAARLSAVRDALRHNETLLERHLRAAREISTIVAASIAREEWDGTYDAPSPAQGRPAS